MEYIARGIILQARNFKDEDKLYYIFTYERGLIRAVAKSVASTRSKLSGFLMPGNLCIFMLAQGNAIDKIAQVKTISFCDFFKDYKKFSSFSRVAEVLLNYLPEAIEERYIYEQSIDFLKDMNSDFDILDLEICYFLSIISQFGFSMDFNINMRIPEKKIIESCLVNTYLKNKEMVLSLNYDKLLVYSYIKSYFERNLDKKLNSF